MNKQERRSSIKYMMSQGISFMEAQQLLDYYDTYLSNFTDFTPTEDSTTTQSVTVIAYHPARDYCDNMYEYISSMGGISY